MRSTQSLHSLAALLLLGVLTACATNPTTTTQSSATATDNFGNAVSLRIPAVVPVTVDARTSALLILDISSAICQPRPACVASVPAIASLLSKARASNVPVIYSSTATPAGPSPMLAEVAPRSGEPTVVSSANKFTNTDLEDILKQRNITTLVVAGSAANGAVLYTSFHANTRGFTVVVADDGISSPVAVNTQVARYQLLNQPGYTNADNTPLADKKVTLSRSDLITFR
jgi:nicotinamidase-related amidase